MIENNLPNKLSTTDVGEIFKIDGVRIHSMDEQDLLNLLTRCDVDSGHTVFTYVNAHCMNMVRRDARCGPCDIAKN